MYSRCLLLLLSFTLLSYCTPPKPDVVAIQLLDNVRAGVSVYQAYDVPESAIENIKQANEMPLTMQFLVDSLIHRACPDVADDNLRSCESDSGPIDWFTLSTTTLCLTAENIAGRGPVKNNVCLIFPHAIPFPTDFEGEPKVVNLEIFTGKKWLESGYTNIEVIEIKIH